MPKYFTFAAIDEETRKVLLTLAGLHPVLANHATIQKLQNDKHAADIPVLTVARINETILKRSHHLAREAATAPENRRFLILSEQNLLNTIAATISGIVAANMQTAVSRLANVLESLR